MKRRLLATVVSLSAFAGYANHATYIETYAKGGVERWEDVSHIPTIMKNIGSSSARATGGASASRETSSSLGTIDRKGCAPT